MKIRPVYKTEWLIYRKDYSFYDSYGQEFLCWTFLDEYFILPKGTKELRLLFYKKPVRNSYRIYLRNVRLVAGTESLRWSWEQESVNGPILYPLRAGLREKLSHFLVPDETKKLYLKIECRESLSRKNRDRQCKGILRL